MDEEKVLDESFNEDIDEETEEKRKYEKVDINQFYLDEKGQIKYCELCNECIYDCKESHKVIYISCPKQVKANKNNTYT